MRSNAFHTKQNGIERVQGKEKRVHCTIERILAERVPNRQQSVHGEHVRLRSAMIVFYACKNVFNMECG
jgi:hypothetical protein